MRYTAFGLSIASSHPIPRLKDAPSNTAVDLHIELGRPAWFQSSRPARVRYTSPYLDSAGLPMLTLSEIDRDWLRLSFADGTDFLVDRSGSRMHAMWPAPFTIEDAASYLLGPVMGFVLRLRGSVCLHASAVAVAGEALAIVGVAGAGKSTTAGAFACGGWPVLSDDVVPLSEDAGGFKAHPGYPRLRLWPASVDAIGQLTDIQPAVPDNLGDRRFHLDLAECGLAFQSTPLPLAAVYVLAGRDPDLVDPQISSCSGTDALMALVTHSFASTLLDRDMRAHDLATLGRLVDAIPMRTVTSPGRLDRLPALVDAILDDFRTLPRSNLLAS